MREEMNRAGAIELLMPVGAAGGAVAGDAAACSKYGPELLRIKDRHERDFCVQPTQRGGHHRHRAPGAAQLPQLPVNFYQIQTKFRDEIRPRFGVMRAREFTMKDAYSFDRDLDGASRELRPHVRRLRPHLHAPGPEVPRRGRRHRRDRRRPLARVPGDRRHGRGRDRLLRPARTTPPTSSSPKRCRRRPRARRRPKPHEEDADARQGTCEDVAAFLGLPLERTVKSLVLATDEPAPTMPRRTTIWLLLVRGDHVAERGQGRASCRACAGFRFATDSRDRARTSAAEPGYLGPRAAATAACASSPTAPSRR